MESLVATIYDSPGNWTESSKKNPWMSWYLGRKQEREKDNWKRRKSWMRRWSRLEKNRLGQPRFPTQNSWEVEMGSKATKSRKSPWKGRRMRESWDEMSSWGPDKRRGRKGCKSTGRKRRELWICWELSQSRILVDPSMSVLSRGPLNTEVINKCGCTTSSQDVYQIGTIKNSYENFFSKLKDITPFTPLFSGNSVALPLSQDVVRIHFGYTSEKHLPKGSRFILQDLYPSLQLF